jgi:hypothetical protein
MKKTPADNKLFDYLINESNEMLGILCLKTKGLNIVNENKIGARKVGIRKDCWKDH